jgi:hypothetical protein
MEFGRGESSLSGLSSIHFKGDKFEVRGESD